MMKLFFLFAIPFLGILQNDNNVAQVLTLSMVKSALPNASEIQVTNKEKPYPSIFYKGVNQGKEFTCHLTIAYGIGSLSNFDRSTSYIKDAITVDGIGDKAVYSAKMGQYSVLCGKNIFHVSATYGASEEIPEVALNLVKKVTDKMCK